MIDKIWWWFTRTIVFSAAFIMPFVLLGSFVMVLWSPDTLFWGKVAVTCFAYGAFALFIFFIDYVLRESVR